MKKTKCEDRVQIILILHYKVPTSFINIKHYEVLKVAIPLLHFFFLLFGMKECRGKCIPFMVRPDIIAKITAYDASMQLSLPCCSVRQLEDRNSHRFFR